MPSFATLRALFSRRRVIDPATLLDRILHRASPSAGPPAIAAARAQCRDHPDIFISPLETRFGMIGGRIAVRGWILLSEADGSPDLREVARRFMQAFADNGRMADIFFLSVSYGIKTGDIATLLGMSRRAVRRLLLEAIERIDRTFRDYTPAAPSGDSREPAS